MALNLPSRLYRSRSEKMIAGVAGGLAEYFDVDPVLVRLLFVVTTLASGVGILAYIVLWIVVPRQGDESLPRSDALRGEVEGLYHEARGRIDPNAPPGETVDAGGVAEGTSEGGAAPPFAADPAAAVERRRRRRHWAGAILIIIGVIFLAQNLGLLWWVHPKFLLPLVLVGVGGWLLFGRTRRGVR